MLCLVSNIRAKISSNYAMPSWVVFLVKLFLDKCCNILQIERVKWSVIFYFWNNKYLINNYTSDFLWQYTFTRNYLFDIELLKCLWRAINRILLHILRHISILNDGFSLWHDETFEISKIMKWWEVLRLFLIMFAMWDFWKTAWIKK